MPKSSKKPAENATNAENNYVPTKKEEALLEIMLNPLNRLKNVEELCSLAGCGRDVYYHAFRKQGFVALYKEMSVALVVKGIAPVINSVVREASRGSHQHAKIVLGMAGVYNEKTVQELTGPNGGPILHKRELSEEELLAIASKA